MRAESVTITGGPLRIGRRESDRLRHSSCRVNRISATSPEKTERKLDQIAATGDQFNGF